MNKKKYKKEMNRALEKLVEIALLYPDERVSIRYEVAIENDRAVPYVYDIRIKGEAIFSNERAGTNDRNIVGSQGTNAEAYDATPQQARILIQQYYDEVFK